MVACIRKYCLGPTEVSLKFFTFSRYSGPPYDHSITCSTGHLRRVNSNSLHNFRCFNPCHSQSSHHKDVLLSAPPLVPNQMTSKFLCSLRTPCTQSYQASTFNKPSLSSPPSPPIRSLPLVGKLRICPPLGLDKEILNSPRFFIPLIIPETQRCYTILTSRQYVKNQEQSDATAASPEVIATYYSGMTLLPKNNSLCPH